MPLKEEGITFPERRGTPHHRMVLARRQKQELGESLGQTLCSVRKARPGRVNLLGLASVSNFGRSRAIGMVSSCHVPSPGMIWGRGNTCLVCET